MDIKNKSNFGGLDYFRIAAAILVIAVHTSPLLNISSGANLILTRIIARVAVPFFFITTGFFLYKNAKIENFNCLQYLKKIGFIYIVAVILYLPINIYMGYFSKNDTLLNILKDLLFNGTIYHLWYLPALMLGVLIVNSVLKRFGYSKTLMLTLCLYFIGLLGDSYTALTLNNSYLTSFYSFLFKIFDYTRNGLFFAPIFIFMGILIYKGNKIINIKNAKLGFILSFVALLIEGISLHQGVLLFHDSMYIALIPTMFFLYHLLLGLKLSNSALLRKMSLIVYLAHPFIIVAIRAFAKITGIGNMFVDNNLLHFVTVTAISLVVAYILCKATTKKQGSDKGRAWIEVNLNNLEHNYKEIKALLPDNCEFMAVVKANAYGHGAVKVAQRLQLLGCNNYAVASINEAIKLRKANIYGDILILGYTSETDIPKLKKYNLVQTAVDSAYAELLNKQNLGIRTHVKLDTGMHRLGVDYSDFSLIEKTLKLPNIKVEGIYTHLCVADSLSSYNIKYTKHQIRGFYQVLQKIKALGLPVPKHHIQSSYGVVNYPELSCNYARVGIFLYGSKTQTSDEIKTELDLKPLLSIKARISGIKNIPAHQPIGYGRKHISIKDLTIATLTIGYADGIPRNLSDAYVLVNDQKAPIIGVICMDQMTIDITDIKNVKQGDIVTILGQDSQNSVPPLQFAASANIITNELYSRLGERLNRVYV